MISRARTSRASSSSSGARWGWRSRSATCTSRAWCRPALAGGSIEEFLAQLLRATTQRCAQRYEAAHARGKVLRYVGKITAAGEATVGLQELDRAHAFANIALTDNVVRFATRRYCDNPLIVQGPGRVRRSPPAACSPTCCGSPPTWGRACEHGASAAGAAPPRSRRPRSAMSPSASTSSASRSRRSATGRRVARSASPGRAHQRRSAASPGDLPLRARAQHGRARAHRHAGGAAAGLRLRARDRQGHPARLGPRAARRPRRSPRWSRPMRSSPRPCPPLELLKFAMQGEAVASGSLHVDNIAPSLFGGLVLTVGIDHPRVKQIPVPPGDPRGHRAPAHVPVDHAKARAILKGSVELADFVWQTANLAGFISGCYTNDLDMMRESFEDVVIEPQRQALIPGFARRAQRARWRPARSAARSPAPARRCSPGPRAARRRRCARRWCRVLAARTYERSLDHRGSSPPARA